MTTRPKRKTATESRTVGKDALAKPRRTPRKSKRARLIDLLKHASGSDVATLSRELGWQQHTTRAALTKCAGDVCGRKKEAESSAAGAVGLAETQPRALSLFEG